MSSFAARIRIDGRLYSEASFIAISPVKFGFTNLDSSSSRATSRILLLSNSSFAILDSIIARLSFTIDCWWFFAFLAILAALSAITSVSPGLAPLFVDGSLSVGPLINALNKVSFSDIVPTRIIALTRGVILKDTSVGVISFVPPILNDWDIIKRFRPKFFISERPFFTI